MRAREITIGLGGQWRSGKGTAKCPAHDDRNPSLSISETRDGRALVYCFTGCSQIAVIDALRARGLWDGEAKGDPGYPGFLTTKHDGQVFMRDARDRLEFARTLWDKAVPARDTIVDTYLASRGIKRGERPALRYLPLLKHGPSKTSHPCMIAALTDEKERIRAVQRTWLKPDGSGKADIHPAKMTLGQMADSAVKFGQVGNSLGLAEGIETALSAAQIYHVPVWATLSANRLDQIKIPATVRDLFIFADHGQVGMREATEAANHYEGQGLRVDVIPPKVHFGDGVADFNDAVRAQ